MILVFVAVQKILICVCIILHGISWLLMMITDLTVQVLLLHYHGQVLQMGIILFRLITIPVAHLRVQAIFHTVFVHRLHLHRLQPVHPLHAAGAQVI